MTVKLRTYQPKPKKKLGSKYQATEGNEALDILKLLVDAYWPEHSVKSGSPQCNFCREFFLHMNDFALPEKHKPDCPWPVAYKLAMSKK